LLHSLFPNPATFLSLAAIVNEPFNPLDAMVVDYSLGENNQNLAAFELVLLLRDVRPYIGQRKRSVRFGTIVGGEDVLRTLSRLNGAKRSGFSVYIEYRCT